MGMCFIATVQHHASAVYMLYMYSMTSVWLQGLPYHNPVYNTIACMQIYMTENTAKLKCLSPLYRLTHTHRI